MFATYVKLVLSMLIWGGTWVAGRIVAAEMEPFSAAFLRFLFAGVFLLAVTFRVERRFPLPERGQLVPLALLGLTGIFGYNAFFFSALQTVEAGRASLIIASIPACMALLACLFMGERLSPSRLAGIPLSLFGVAVILSDFHPERLFTGGVGRGELFLFGCVASWTAYSLLGKRFMTTMSPLFAVTWSCLMGCALLFPFALGEGLAARVATVSPAVWGNLVFLGVMATGLAFCWYYAAIKAIGASRAGVFINLVPVAAIGLGVLILGEKVTLSLAFGGAMVMTGVFMTNRPQRNRSH
ncbi:protein of unknown function DUF6 transmembrane [Alkalidesulfovibrio alkalitolerans DSM 16529]|jgi:drug/metabolite transporter (DMT)-like permease|uniref:EamA domain-containing protein n=1 Tax=Alkalidesulfovibrio alkalitolerans DSM 16529 TaxID=1121439 RepID=S7T2X7_9BACT|nr:DMT family transporter [Alkalidesulfovibrio alkalitolerans]EPR31432.1 protein of unknown function DUF6 transmembrane [Alkalidesulfovibrio alkalitolerans DSM 16529]